MQPIAITQMLVPPSKWHIKAPYEMKPEYIVIHNTYNDASAMNEISYMIRNNNLVSYHYAVDDNHAVQGLPLNRNGWHAGDGKNGKGNRKGIGIEICYSKSGGERYYKAEENSAILTAMLLNKYGLGLDRVKFHYQFMKKHCPHRMLDENRIHYFLERVQKYLKELQTPKKEVVIQKNNMVRLNKHALTYATGQLIPVWVKDKLYTVVQEKNDKILLKEIYSWVYKKDTDYNIQQPTITKTNEQLADEVLKGLWGNGIDRKNRLEKAGYNYSAVQAIVNKRVGK